MREAVQWACELFPEADHFVQGFGPAWHDKDKGIQHWADCLTVVVSGEAHPEAEQSIDALENQLDLEGGDLVYLTVNRDGILSDVERPWWERDA